jgi:hypothetical protein
MILRTGNHSFVRETHGPLEGAIGLAIMAAIDQRRAQERRHIARSRARNIRWLRRHRRTITTANRSNPTCRCQTDGLLRHLPKPERFPAQLYLSPSRYY